MYQRLVGQSQSGPGVREDAGRILAPLMPLGLDDIKRVFARYHEHLATYRDALNGLNVYPVPDGDTGTNMALTVASFVDQVDRAQTMEEAATAISHGSLMGARGNSGVILSQILRGLAEEIRDETKIDAPIVRAALARATAAAYGAVQRPVEGTILTVLRAAADAASGAVDESELVELLDAVYRRAVDALERTPDMLPVLRQAGVVDAGAAGLVLLLAAFLEVERGDGVALPDHVLMARADLNHLDPLDSGVADLRYEVMFFLEAGDAAVEEFRSRWSTLGDSIVVVGGSGTWNCHIHTDHIGPSIEAGIAAGRPRDIRVTDLFEQAGHREIHAFGPAFEPLVEYAVAPVGVVAVVAGEGMVEVFRRLGVQGVVVGGQTMNPSTEDLLAVVEQVPADQVVLLPNNKNIVPVAEQVEGLTTKHVVVVPTRSVPQGVAAMMGYSPVHTSADLAVEDMAAAASSIVDGEITRAVRDARIGSEQIHRGDWLAIADGTIVTAGSDLEAALRGLVAAVLPPFAELLTLYTGDGAAPSVTKALVAWLDELHPELTVEVVAGGQPLYPYLISIE